MKKYRIPLILASFLCLAVLFYYFASLTPYMTDNYIFSRDIHPGYAAFYKGAEISSQPMTFQGAFRQAVEMYSTWCGRFMGNLAVYLLFMLPHALYCLLAALVFCLYIFLLLVCVFGPRWRENISPGWIFGMAALLWVGMPSFGEAFFWLSVGGQIAMLAQAAIFAIFRFLLEPTSASGQNWPINCNSWLNCVLFFLGGVMTCSLDYPTSAVMPPTSLALVIYLYFFKKNTFRQNSRFLISGLLGLCLGAALTLLAPGNACRIRITDDINVHIWQAASWPERIWSWLSHLPQFFLWESIPLTFLALACWIMWREYGKGWIKKIPIAALLFLLPAILTVGAFLFSVWPPPRAFATCTAQLLICASIIFAASQKKGTPFSRKPFRYAVIAFGCFCLLSVSYEIVRFHILHEAIQKREEILLSSKDKTAILPPLPIKPTSQQALGGELADISEDPSFWVNRAMASFYGVKKIEKSTRSIYVCNLAAKSAKDNDKIDNLKVRINNGKLELSVPNPELPHLSGEINFYYRGYPGLIAYLPNFIDNMVYSWLICKNDWRKNLIPILLARTDVQLEPDKRQISYSRPLKIDSFDEIWLVCPGESKYSFNLLPMRCGIEN